VRAAGEAQRSHLNEVVAIADEEDLLKAAVWAKGLEHELLAHLLTVEELVVLFRKLKLCNQAERERVLTMCRAWRRIVGLAKVEYSPPVQRMIDDLGSSPPEERERKKSLYRGWKALKRDQGLNSHFSHAEGRILSALASTDDASREALVELCEAYDEFTSPRYGRDESLPERYSQRTLARLMGISPGTLTHHKHWSPMVKALLLLYESYRDDLTITSIGCYAKRACHFRRIEDIPEDEYP
jgi:hypothetical protein